MSGRTKMAIFDSCALLWNNSGRRVFFYTFTLPCSQFSDQARLNFRDGMRDKDVAKIFSKAKNNFRMSYGFDSYVEAREIQNKTTKNIHFHLVTSADLDPLHLSGYWGGLLGVDGNRNCVDKRFVFDDVRNVASYLAKYMSAEGNSRPVYTRKMARSQDLVVKPVVLAQLPTLKIESEFALKSKEGYEVKGVNYNTAAVLEKFEFPIGSGGNSPLQDAVDEETGELIFYE